MSIPMPFAGVKDDSKCAGLSRNHGLYTQCDNKLCGENYCKRCKLEVELTGKPRYGTINDRIACDKGMYQDPKGVKEVHYGNVIKKLKLKHDIVKAEAIRLKCVLSESDLEVRVASRGRPKKSKEVGLNDVSIKKTNNKSVGLVTCIS